MQSQLSNKRGKKWGKIQFKVMPLPRDETWARAAYSRVARLRRPSACSLPPTTTCLSISFLPSPSFSPQSLCSLSSYLYIPAQLNDDYCNISKASSDISGKSLNYPDYQVLPMKIIRLGARFQVRWIIRVTVGDFEVHPGAYTNLSAHICALINPW